MMKLKLVNIFAVCLITLLVLFPSLAVFGMVWEQHLKFIEMQHIPSYHQSIKSKSAPGLEISSLTNDANATKLSLFNNYQILHLWRWLFLLLPFCIGVAIYLYDRYLVLRANMHQQQVEMLEKLWQQFEK